MMMTVKTQQAEGTRVRGHEEEAIGYGVRKPPPCPRFDLLLKGRYAFTSGASTAVQVALL